MSIFRVGASAGAAFFLLFGAAAQAAERITAFHSDIRIAASGEITVTETIEVQAEGREIQRGILRDFPADYRDRLGNRVAVPLAVDKVVRNRRPEHYALERLANGTRIRIGGASRTLPQGKHVYEITYRTGRQIGFFDTHDELYWNVNGSGWAFAFDRLTAEVTFERPVPAKDLRVEAYTGAQGARGHDYNAFVRQGSVAFRASRPLAPREGMTIVVAFPKGVIAAPSAFERTTWYVASNGGVAIGAGIFAVMLALLFTCWSRFGRRPVPVAWILLGAGIGIVGILAMIALDTPRYAVSGLALAMLVALAGFSRFRASGKALSPPRRPSRRRRSAPG